MIKDDGDDSPGPDAAAKIQKGLNKKLTIAFIYNIRHHYPDSNDPRTQLETDFDDPETIEMIIKHLKKCGFKIIPVEANKEAYLKLYKYRHKIDVAFNLSEGIYGKSRESHIPAMLEMLQIPYTGSTASTQSLVLNKAKTKQVLIVHNVPTANYQVFASANEKLKKNLKFPLIVKPVAQGSSAGITNNSLVFNEEELKRQINFVINTFAQEALVETFLKGREFSVSMLGNPPQILPIIESCHDTLPKEYHPFDSLEVKWNYEEQGEKGHAHLICPAAISSGLYKKIGKLCLKTWEVLEILDWCRIDIRCDEKENPFVLEVNSPAGILPPEISTTSYYPRAARAMGMDYPTLLKNIISLSLKRYESNCTN